MSNQSTPQIKYIVDRRRKATPVTPCIVIHGVEFTASEPMTIRDAQQISRCLVADAHHIQEQFTKKYHEEVEYADLMRDIQAYDE